MKYVRQILTVTQWEYHRFFKPKNELIGIVIGLIIALAFHSGSRYLLSDKGGKGEIYVSRNMEGSVLGFLSESFVLNEISENNKDQILSQIESEKDGVFLLSDDQGFKLHAYKKTRALRKIKSALGAYTRTVRMQEAGISEEDLAIFSQPADITELYVIPEKPANRVVLAYFFAGLMLMAVFLSFAYQFTAITGEKQLRITEQIVSAVKPQAWMDGKIYGITLTGLSSMVTYSIISILAGVIIFQFTGVPAAAVISYLHLPSILLFILFSLVGILIWNAILAAIASVITDPNSSGKSQYMMLPVLFVVLSVLVIRDPDSSLSAFLSWFPLTSSSAMPVRWAISETAWWELAGSLILLAGTFYFFRILAARIFRMSILISGKEPGWSEVFKFLFLKEKRG